MMSTSAWPTPTVSSSTTSRPDASISSAAWSVASLSPPSAPRLAIERMNTPGSRKWSVRRIRSPSSAPFVNGEEGSIDSTATVRSRARSSFVSAPSSVDLPRPGGPVKPMHRRPAGARIDLADQRPALGVVVLDQRDRRAPARDGRRRAAALRAIRRRRPSRRAIMPVMRRDRPSEPSPTRARIPRVQSVSTEQLERTRAGGIPINAGDRPLRPATAARRPARRSCASPASTTCSGPATRC